MYMKWISNDLFITIYMIFDFREVYRTLWGTFPKNPHAMEMISYLFAILNVL